MYKKRFWRKWVPLLILGIALYLLLGAILPYLFHPKITRETEEAFARTEFLGEETGPERVRVIADNGEALAQRIRLISQAQERIILSTFDIRSDESGKDILAALCDAADRGVRVQVVVDGFCGFTQLQGNEYFMALSALENAELRIYNPIHILKPWHLMARLHDKYLVVDDDAYLLGGRNTHDYFLGTHDGMQNYDWDVLVWQSRPGTEGTSLEMLTDYFGGVWESPACRSYHNDRRELERPAVAGAMEELRERYQTMQRERPDWFAPVDYETITRPTNRIQLLSNPIQAGVKEPTAFYAMTRLMAQGKEEVRFHTPYLICDDWMLGRLARICREVPSVTVMTNSVANNGNFFGAMDYAVHKGAVLDTGVEILEFDGGISYHGKCFVIDHRLSGVGSFNWDMRSAYIDTELMLVIDSEEVNADLRREMARYEDQALTVVDEETSIAPVGIVPQERSFAERLLSGVLRLTVGWARFLM